MSKELEETRGTLTALAANTHVDVRLEGWSAAAAIGSACAAAVAIVAIIFSNRE